MPTDTDEIRNYLEVVDYDIDVHQRQIEQNPSEELGEELKAEILLEKETRVYSSEWDVGKRWSNFVRLAKSRQEDIVADDYDKLVDFRNREYGKAELKRIEAIRKEEFRKLAEEKEKTEEEIRQAEITKRMIKEAREKAEVEGEIAELEAEARRISKEQEELEIDYRKFGI